MKNLLLKLNERKGIVSCVLLLLMNFGYAQTVQTFTTPGLGSVVIPAGVTTVTVEVWGAGGGGGNSNDDTQRGGSGGGGGAYARGIHTVTPGSTYFYTVGSGGNGGPGGSIASATSGGSSWFNSTTSNTAPLNQFTGLLATGGWPGVNNSNAMSRPKISLHKSVKIWNDIQEKVFQNGNLYIQKNSKDLSAMII